MGPITTKFVDIQADLDAKGCTLVRVTEPWAMAR